MFLWEKWSEFSNSPLGATLRVRHKKLQLFKLMNYNNSHMGIGENEYKLCNCSTLKPLGHRCDNFGYAAYNIYLYIYVHI